LLRRLNAEMGKTVIMVTHDWHAVESARRVTHLEKGELVDEPAVVRQEPGTDPASSRPGNRAR
jgi:ABC-type lipoprotein export system ATPase subunit